MAPKPKKKKPAGYDWGDGRKVHSIPLAQHQANRGGVAAYGLPPQASLDAPLSAGQAFQMANAAAGQQYDPQILAAKAVQNSTPGWYQGYLDRAAAAQTAAQAYAQPLLNQAQAGVQNAGATTPGLDPNSPQAQKDAQAAQGRQAIAQLGYDTLAVVPASTNAYMAGQQAIAARDLPQTLSYLGQQVGQLQGQRGQAAASAYGDIRAQEQNASIARQTLGLNTAKAAADVDIARGVDPVTGKALPQEAPKGYAPGGPGLNKYGYTYDQSWGMSPQEQAKERNRGTTNTAAKDAERKRKETEKKRAAIKKSTGKVKTDVQNAVSAWNGYIGQETDDTSKPKDPITGEYPGRPSTPSDIKRILQGKGYDAGLIHVALLVRAKKPLDQAAIDYLHAKDPNIRVPREWLSKASSGTLDRPNRAPAPKNDRSGYGDRPN